MTHFAALLTYYIFNSSDPVFSLCITDYRDDSTGIRYCDAKIIKKEREKLPEICYWLNNVSSMIIVIYGT
jgi:hypothetical protein